MASRAKQGGTTLAQSPVLDSDKCFDGLAETMLSNKAGFKTLDSTMLPEKQNEVKVYHPHDVRLYHMGDRDVESIRSKCEKITELEKRRKTRDRHINALHEYNKFKDMAQSLMGKLAQMEGVRTKDMYERFGLKIED